MSEDHPFAWKRHPKAEKFLVEYLNEVKSPAIERLEHDLLHYSSTRLLDWLSHVIIPFSEKNVSKLEKLGFTLEYKDEGFHVFELRGAQLPRVELNLEGEKGIAVVVDDISSFFMAQNITQKILGTPFSLYREAIDSKENGTLLKAVERRGTRFIRSIDEPLDKVGEYLEAVRMWRCRPRDHFDGEILMDQAHELAEEMVRMLGKDKAAHVVLLVEREYWQSRNRAAVIQKGRQDRLGMGWSNHDHHTFRSSRKHFKRLIELFEIIGFSCRERFYAGEEAGWGAQVMENPNLPAVLFLDVDLDPDEIELDFARIDLPEEKELGTIGLWCGLHRDSIFAAGMHHLEAQFQFDQLKEDLEKESVDMMVPFSDFPYLKQAFTKAEIWKVPPRRIKALLDQNFITKEQAEKFTQEGALGSHLENLQRREGYKGFNQKNVSLIIKKTDPRGA